MILNSKDIVREQTRSMLPEYKVYVRSIGVKFQIENTTRLVHDSHGDEQETLIFLHDHCRINENDTVIYLHNKGSFHPSRQNHKLRKFLTESALSKECVNMPDYCNVCASRMSPFPHPHTSGNMWTAKCSYVRMLMNPKKFRDKLDMIYNPFTRNKDHDSCNGLGRFSVEHWIYSHPKVSPCDVSNSSFAWSYRGVPSAPFQFDLKQAPRFKLPFYEKKVCPSQTIETRLKEYNAMYGEMPDICSRNYSLIKKKEKKPAANEEEEDVKEQASDVNEFHENDDTEEEEQKEDSLDGDNHSNFFR